MRHKNGLTGDGPLEFGTGLRARLARAQTLAREDTNGIVAPALHVVEGAGPETVEVPDDAFELLLDLTRKVDGRENLDLRHSRAIALVSRSLAHELGLDADAAQRA